MDGEHLSDIEHAEEERKEHDQRQH